MAYSSSGGTQGTCWGPWDRNMIFKKTELKMCTYYHYEVLTPSIFIVNISEMRKLNMLPSKENLLSIKENRRMGDAGETPASRHLDHPNNHHSRILKSLRTAKAKHFPFNFLIHSPFALSLATRPASRTLYMPSSFPVHFLWHISLECSLI